MCEERMPLCGLRRGYDRIAIKRTKEKDPARNGREGTILTSELLPDKSQFSQEELEILDAVYQRFKKEGPTKISETSHQEEAWKKYINRDELISFDMAFCLKAI